MMHRYDRVAMMAVLTMAAAGCATDGPVAPLDPPIPGRAITQNAPAPDYTVFYWNALRACLQTGRSEWECKSGEDRFVRDALAVEAELEAQRQQRRRAALERAAFRDGTEAAAKPPPTAPRSLMFERQPIPETAPGPDLMLEQPELESRPGDSER